MPRESILPRDERIAAARRVRERDGQNWCSSCMRQQSLDGGKWRVNGRGQRTRWVCADCLAEQRRLKQQPLAS